MRVVGSPHQVVEADDLAGQYRRPVVFDGRVELPSPDLVGSFAGEITALEAILAQESLVDPVQPMGDPAGIELAHDELEVRMPLGNASAHQVHQRTLHRVRRGRVVEGLVPGQGTLLAVLRGNIGVRANVHRKGKVGFLRRRPEGFVALVLVRNLGRRRARNATALEAFLDDPVDFIDGGLGVLDGNRRQPEQPPVRCARIVVQPVVVVLLAGDEQFGVLEAEQAEEAGIEEFRLDAVLVLIFVPVGTVPNARSQAVVAHGKDAPRLGVAHVVDFGFVPGTTLQFEAVAFAHAGEPHASTDAARSLARNDDRVLERPGADDPGRIVTETLGQANEHVFRLDHM